jgi:REP element-mobilizing transposase RayT
LSTAPCCDIIVRSLLHCREHKALKIYAWVIVDNHFHAILSAPELAKAIRDLKRFTARLLLEQLKIERREWLLNQLAY